MRVRDILDPKGAILSRVTQEQIMRYYLKIEIDLNKLYRSPLREDKNPGCSFYYAKSGRLYFNDFALGKKYDFIGVVQTLYNCSYVRALRIIRDEIHMIKGVDGVVEQKEDVDIRIVATPVVHSYWSKYCISPEILELFDVFTVSSVYRNEDLYLKSNRNNPIFAYLFPSGRIKIYRPYSKTTKWYGNATGEDIGGANALPKKGKLCFITSSIKDCMVLRVLGFGAVCMQGEGYGINGKTSEVMKELVGSLKKRFNHVVLLLDNDDSGIKFAAELSKAFNLPSLLLDGAKDISDHIAKYGYYRTHRKIKKRLSKHFKVDDIPF